MIDTKELRRLAEEQQWIGRWYDAGCETLMAERNGEHEEVAHLTPIGLVPYLVAVQPAAISELLDRLESVESDALEQARLDGMGSEREAALMAKLEAAEKDIALKERIIDSLGSELNAVANERDELRARIEEMEEQKPVAWQSRSRPSWGAHQWGNWESCSPGYAQDITKSPTLHDWQYEARPLYTLPGAKGE